MSKYCAYCGLMHEQRLSLCTQCGRVLAQLPPAVEKKVPEAKDTSMQIQVKASATDMTADENDTKGFILNIVLAVSVLITGNMIGWLAVFSAITRNLLIGIGLAVLCALMVINGLLLLQKKWAGVIITRSRYCIQSILWLVLLIIGIVKAQSNVYLPAAAMLVLQNILLVAAFRYYKPRRNYMK